MKIAIISLGCPKNQVDADVFCHALIKDGHTTVADPAEADIIIINTCGFIESAKAEAIENILMACQYKQQNPDLKVVVTGCLAERYKQQIVQEIPEVDAVVGIGSNAALPAIVRRLCAAGAGQTESYGPKTDMQLGGARVISTPRHYAYLKIAEGCNNRCHYCAIPLIRGPLRSREIKDCVAEARWLAGEGVKELILVAQDPTAYGEDWGKPGAVCQLLDELQAIDGIRWIRVLYAYPERITDEFIAALVRKKKGDGELEFAMVCVPGGLPRVVELPCQEGKSIIYLEEVIERNIDKLFLNYDIISCHPFRVMRNADLSIDEDEAEVIRLIFHKYVDEGYGAQRLSHYLHEQGIKSRDGKGFPNTTVNRIIKNIAYTGIIKNGESQSGYIDELRIIDVSTFSKAQEIMRQRTLPHGNVPLNCKGKSLLVGNIFCAHCGNRLTLTTSGRRVYRADGTVKYEPRMRYQCHYNVRHPGECDGQSGYGVTKLDGIVEKVIRMKFAEIAAAPESEILNHQHKKEIELAKIKLDQANAHMAEKQKDLSDYKAETLKVIRGQSNLSVELLNALVKETETMIALAQTRIDAAQTEYESLLASAENLRQEYDRLLTWADLFDTCSFEAKKMIVAQFVKAVRVSRDYNIEIDFNVS